MAPNTLETGIRNVRNVRQYTIGSGAIDNFPELIKNRRQYSKIIIFFIDEFFKNDNQLTSTLAIEDSDELIFVEVQNEPSTEYVDELVSRLSAIDVATIGAIVGVGGGTTLDIAKAVSNLLTNGGKAEHYQGWNLVKKPGIYKIAVPTLSGTGAEATRTCVMLNQKSGLKLGMNSDFTVFDQVIMDPNLTKTVPRNQYFYTGMDSYIHCIESLGGSYRNAIGDSFSHQSIGLCRDVFTSNNMMSDENRAKLMVASYLGGCAIATSYVGVIHPFSAGLSVVFDTHHCVANCIVMRAMEEFYPAQHTEFWQMAKNQDIVIPQGNCQDLSPELYDRLYAATIIHKKPLTNALGEKFKEILTKEKVIQIFKMM